MVIPGDNLKLNYNTRSIFPFLNTSHQYLSSAYFLSCFGYDNGSFGVCLLVNSDRRNRIPTTLTSLYLKVSACGAGSPLCERGQTSQTCSLLLHHELRATLKGTPEGSFKLHLVCVSQNKSFLI